MFSHRIFFAYSHFIAIFRVFIYKTRYTYYNKKLGLEYNLMSIFTDTLSQLNEMIF